MHLNYNVLTFINSWKQQTAIGCLQTLPAETKAEEGEVSVTLFPPMSSSVYFLDISINISSFSQPCVQEFDENWCKYF